LIHIQTLGIWDKGLGIRGFWEYCGAGTASTNQLNANLWKNEYCFRGDDAGYTATVPAYTPKVAACPGGKHGLTQYKHSEPAWMRCEKDAGPGGGSCTADNYAACTDPGDCAAITTSTGPCSTEGCYEWDTTDPSNPVCAINTTTQQYACSQYSGGVWDDENEICTADIAEGSCNATGTTGTTPDFDFSQTWTAIGTCSKLDVDASESQSSLNDNCDVIKAGGGWATTEGECIYSHLNTSQCTGLSGTMESFGTCKYDNASLANATGTCSDIGSGDGYTATYRATEGVCVWKDVAAGAGGTQGCTSIKAGLGSGDWTATEGKCTWSGLTSAVCSASGTDSWNGNNDAAAATGICIAANDEDVASDACTILLILGLRPPQQSKRLALA